MYFMCTSLVVVEGRDCVVVCVQMVLVGKNRREEKNGCKKTFFVFIILILMFSFVSSMTGSLF